jgi:carbonic anhydrase
MVEKELRDWIDNFHHPVDNVRETVAQIRSNPLIPKDVPVHGLIMEPSTGAIEIIIDGYKACRQSQIT